MMSGFCDECGTSFLRPTSKWCSECGTPRHEDLMETELPLEVMENGGGPNGSGQDEALELPIWALPNHPTLTLQSRVYGKRPAGLPKEISWGKKFLKEHYCYRKQYKKVLWNQRVLREWFRDSNDAFVDEFVRSDSLRWNFEFIKRLDKYVKKRRRRAAAAEEDNIVDIKFPTDGVTIHWKTTDILRYLSEYKKYRRSSKSTSKRQCNRVPAIESNEEDLVVSNANDIVDPTVMEVPRAEEIPEATQVPTAILPTDITLSTQKNRRSSNRRKKVPSWLQE